jgi:carbonic anhydrase/acetyltransferase-like protein (isoleucine patch superfamily)
LVGPDVSIWYGCVVRADGARITIGPRTNVQDNAILLADADRGPITIGADVTIGHNVQMGACIIEDEALIGMGAEMGDGVVVEPGALVGARALVASGTVVKAGHIWAGRPASAFRPVRPEERDFFLRGKDVYVNYTHNYLAEPAA